MVKDWIEDRKRWMVLAMMKWALRLHEDTFIMLCKITVMDIAMREQGVDRINVAEDDEGNTILVPIYHSKTKH